MANFRNESAARTAQTQALRMFLARFQSSSAAFREDVTDLRAKAWQLIGESHRLIDGCPSLDLSHYVTLTKAVQPTRMAGTAATPQILLVEDEFAIRSALSDALRQAGLEPVEVVSAEEALGLVGRESIRLVITDLEMLGGLGGLDFVLWLSKVRPSLPVIVTSRNRAERMKLGEIPVFEKPYRPGAVVEQAKELLRQH